MQPLEWWTIGAVTIDLPTITGAGQLFVAVAGEASAAGVIECGAHATSGAINWGKTGGGNQLVPAANTAGWEDVDLDSGGTVTAPDVLVRIF